MTYNIFNVIKDEVKGTAEYVSNEEKNRRIAICKGCEHLMKLSQQCGLCGCFISLKAKYAEAECEENKW